MNNLIKVSIFCVVAIFMWISTSQAAAVVCEKMEFWNINAKGAWASNQTGAACGAIPAGGSVYFTFNPAIQDQMLAIALTAMSLQKTIWVSALGEVNGSILDTVGLSK